MTAPYTATPTAAPPPDALALLEDWEVRWLLAGRDAKLKSEVLKRPIILLGRFDVGVLFLDETNPRGRVPLPPTDNADDRS